MTQEEIFSKLKNILVSEFEVDEKSVTMDASLFDDLDLDSIDSIDLIQKMKEFMSEDTKIDPAIFKSVKTIKDVVVALEKYLK